VIIRGKTAATNDAGRFMVLPPKNMKFNFEQFIKSLLIGHKKIRRLFT